MNPESLARAEPEKPARSPRGSRPDVSGTPRASRGAMAFLEDFPEPGECSPSGSGTNGALAPNARALSPDELRPAIAVLRERGATLFSCRAWDRAWDLALVATQDEPKWKQPIGLPHKKDLVDKGDIVDYFSGRELAEYCERLDPARTSLPGIVPATLGSGFIVLDGDTDTAGAREAALDAIRDALGEPWLVLATRADKPHRFHAWFGALPEGALRPNGFWLYGETRCAGGYVCLHGPAARELAEALASPPAGDALVTPEQFVTFVERYPKPKGKATGAQRALMPPDGSPVPEAPAAGSGANGAHAAGEGRSRTRASMLAHEGGRNIELNKQAFIAAKRGEDRAGAYARLRVACTLETAEFDHTFESGWTAGEAERGKPWRGTNGAAPAGEDDDAGMHVAPYRADGLSECLDSQSIRLRYNVLALQAEFLLPGRTEWEKSNDLIMSWVRSRIESTCLRQGKKHLEPWLASDARWKVMINTLLYERQVNPLAEWLETLPEWDGKPRIDDLFQSLWHLDASNSNIALARWGSCFMFLGLVQRTLDPGCKLDEIPLLFGRIDLGKSILGPSMLPAHLQRLFGDSLSLTAKGKERIEATQGKAVVEIPELAGFRIADVDSMTAYLSRTTDEARLSYRRDPEQIPRRWIAYASTNRPDAVPNSPGARRRFAPITIEARREDPAAFLNVHRDLLFAEALARYHRGERANLPSELKSILVEAAEEHRSRETLEDLIEACIGRGDEQGESDALAADQIAGIIGMLHTGTSTPKSYASLSRAARLELAKSLESLGWRKCLDSVQGEDGKRVRARVWRRTVGA